MRGHHLLLRASWTRGWLWTRRRLRRTRTGRRGGCSIGVVDRTAVASTRRASRGALARARACRARGGRMRGLIPLARRLGGWQLRVRLLPDVNT